MNNEKWEYQVEQVNGLGWVTVSQSTNDTEQVAILRLNQMERLYKTQGKRVRARVNGSLYDIR